MAIRSSAGVFSSVSSGFRVGLAAGVMAFALVVGATLAFQIAYSGRVYPGVSALGVSLGGRAPEEAVEVLDSAFRQYAQTSLTVRQADHRWQTTPEDLGLTFDPDAIAREAFLVGREGSVATRVVEQFIALTRGHRIEPKLGLDEARATATLSRFEQEFRRSPANAGLAIAEDGTVDVVPSKAGLGLDVPRAVTTARASLFALSTAEIQLPVRELPVSLTEAQLASVRERAQRIVGRPVTLSAGGSTWTLSRGDLAKLLTVTGQGEAVSLVVDESGLTSHLERYAREFSRQPTDARLEIAGTKVKVVPGENGREVDVTSARTMVLAQLGQSTAIRLPVKEIPGLQPEALAALKTSTEALLSGPATFAQGDRSWLLPPEKLADMLVVKAGAAGSVPTVETDAAKLAKFVEGLAKQADREPLDARFKYRGGKVVVESEAIEGVKVDVAGTVDAALKALSGPRAVIPIRAEVLQPRVTSAAAAEIVVRDLIMESRTNFAGAIPEKVHNIRLAASRLNGTAVPPGSVFSFNRALGPATLASGFKLGYGIAINSNGQMETVPSEAGGICQVATTLFHSAFWAGYPIVERNWHLYWIPKYGAPPRGLKGLDATVDDAYGVDFKFRNSTEHWVVVEASVEGNDLRFALRGIKPSWKVTVGQPIITRVVPANRALVRQPDPSMPVGWSLAVEAAEDGFDASIERTVTEGDRVVDQWTAKATYRPSRNVVLYGTKPVPPTPQPSATPQATPAPQTTPAPGTAATPPTAATPRPAQTAAPAGSPAATPTPSPTPTR